MDISQEINVEVSPSRDLSLILAMVSVLKIKIVAKGRLSLGC